MLALSVSWWDLVVRSIVVYAALFALLRLTGKRQVGQLAPFDLVLLLILSNGVQNAMNAGDNSLTGGLIIALTLILLNWLISYATYRSRRAEQLLDGTPRVIIRHGLVCQDVLDDEHITRAELREALRGAGAFTLGDVKLAVLEANGHVSVWMGDADKVTAAR